MSTLNQILIEKLNKFEVMKLTVANPNINDIDSAFYAYIIQHNIKYDYYLIKYQFK